MTNKTNHAIDYLACSNGRRDEVLNIELAKKIVAEQDTSMVKQLVELLGHKQKDVQFDAIKALYEIGYLSPDLIAPYVENFVKLLDSKQNRMQWGAMTALSAIAPVKPAALYKHLATIVRVADAGSVITNDHCVNILSALASHKKFQANTLPLLLEWVSKSPPNQYPSYAEKTLPCLNADFKSAFIKILQDRMPDINTDAKQKRIDKVLKKALAL